MPKCYFQTTFMKPNNPEGKEPMLSLNVIGFLSSEYVVFHLSIPHRLPALSPGELCPRSGTADCRHLKDSNPIFTTFIFFMPITFYCIYLKHLAGEGNLYWRSSNFLPHQLLTEAVSRSLWELLLKWLGAT